jgi:hypothetical protein
MKKKILVISAILIICLAVIGYIYINWPFITYVDRTIKSYTYINNYTIIQKVHNNHEWYAKISISQSDGEKLYNRYPFKYGYSTKAIAGKLQQDYIKECGNCWYYINSKGIGYYGYVLYCLSSDKKQLEIYEPFDE